MVFLTMLCTSLTYSQEVSGTVSDASGPLPGASVLVKGTKNGAQTDFDGKFTIKNVGSNAILIISYIGLKTQEINVAGKSNIKVTLKEDSAELKEVVVIGYGSVKKKDATGAVDQLSSKKFDNVAATNPSEILRGKVAGVQIATSSGEPGAAVTIRVRGNTSIRSGNGPLIVVDGVPLEGGDDSAGGADSGLGTSSAKSPLNFINQNDIESMSVLKDAASTAIYGARGANGVIIITTKKSKSKEPQLSFSTSVGISNYSSKFDVLSTADYAKIVAPLDAISGPKAYNAAIAEGKSVDDANKAAANAKYNKGGAYNWKDVLLQTGITNNYDLSYATGSENSSTRISLSANNTTGIIKNTGMDKYTLSINNSTTFFGGVMKIEPKVLYSAIKDNTTSLTNNAGYIGNAVATALYWNPTQNVRNADGSFYVRSNDYLNPAQLIDSYTDHTNTSKLLASVNTSLKLSNNLKYNFLMAFENSSSLRQSQLSPSMQISGAAQQSLVTGTDANGDPVSTTYYGQADVNNMNKFNKTFEHTLSYTRELTKDINLDLLAGYSYYNYNMNRNSLTVKGFGANQTNLIDNVQGGIGWIKNSYGPTSGRNEVTLQSYFGRANVDLYKKLILSASIRRDGSSKLGENNKYGNFGALGLAYKVIEAKEGLVNDVKVRGSYGVTGNQEFAPNSALAYANYTAPGQLGNQVSPNPDLKWETTTDMSAGIDFELLNNKLTGTVDVFSKSTENALFAKTAESTQIAPNALKYINLPGKIINRGLEVSLNYKIINTQDLTWDVSGNVSFLTNKMQDFPLFVPMGEVNGQGLSGATAQVLADGYPVYSYYMYDFKGYNSAGNSIYTDTAGNNAELASASPKILDKSALPKINVGFNTSLSYKGFDAAVSFYGAFGHYIYNNTSNALFYKGAFPVRNVTADVTSSTQDKSDPNSPSTKYLEKGDFLRMGNLTFGYTFTGAILEKVKIKSARFFVNGQNLLLFTNYSGFDPEVNINKSFNGVPSMGMDYIAYPKAKTFSMGLNVNF